MQILLIRLTICVIEIHAIKEQLADLVTAAIRTPLTLIQFGGIETQYSRPGGG